MVVPTKSCKKKLKCDRSAEYRSDINLKQIKLADINLICLMNKRCKLYAVFKLMEQLKKKMVGVFG